MSEQDDTAATMTCPSRREPMSKADQTALIFFFVLGCIVSFFVLGGVIGFFASEAGWDSNGRTALIKHIGQEKGQTMGEQDDAVNHPAHYTFGPIEVINAIEAWELNFARGCIVKYVVRAGRKGETEEARRRTEIEDLKKARWYIDKEVKRLEKENG
jgi:hypothetical protein